MKLQLRTLRTAGNRVIEKVFISKLINPLVYHISEVGLVIHAKVDVGFGQVLEDGQATVCTIVGLGPH